MDTVYDFFDDPDWLAAGDSGTATGTSSSSSSWFDKLLGAASSLAPTATNLVGQLTQAQAQKSSADAAKAQAAATSKLTSYIPLAIGIACVVGIVGIVGWVIVRLVRK